MNTVEQPLFILNSEELQFFYLIHFAKKNTTWGHSIDLIIQYPTEEKIRKLIQELKCQYNDNPRAMISILGVTACNQLLKL